MSVSVPLDLCASTSQVGGFTGILMTSGLLMNPNLVMQPAGVTDSISMVVNTFVPLDSLNATSTTALSLTASQDMFMSLSTSSSTLLALVTAMNHVTANALTSVSQMSAKFNVPVPVSLSNMTSQSQFFTALLGATPQIGLSPLGGQSQLLMTVTVPVLIEDLNAESVSQLNDLAIRVPTYFGGTLRSSSTTSVILRSAAAVPLDALASISQMAFALGVGVALDPIEAVSYTSNFYPVAPDKLITPVVDGYIVQYPDGIVTNLPDYEFDLVPSYPAHVSSDSSFETK